MEEDEIVEKIKLLVDYNSKRVKEQETDQTYYEDTFPVAISDPFHIVRTGSGAKIVDDIVAHIETANPQVFREPKKKSKEAIESALKVSRLLNHWISLLIPEIEEGIKNAVQRGEGVFQIEYNNLYNIQDLNSLPVIITAQDPIYVFTEPYDALRPDIVCKQFEIDANYVKSLYPEWTVPKLSKEKRSVTYKAFWDKDWKYFSAGKDDLMGGVKENVYGFTPFVHFYAGFGKKSPMGKPESLSVGKLRKIRGRLKEKCEIESRVDSIIGLYANPMRLLSQIDQNAAEADREALEETYLGPGATLVSPFGWRQEIYTPNVHVEQLLAHLYQIDNALGMESPPILSGEASGARTSGRLEDILYESVQKRYSKLVNNLCNALSQILGMGLRILDTVPQALPVTARATSVIKGKVIQEVETINKEDIDGYYDCRVELNPEQAIENDRKVMLGRVLVNEGRISWKQFLVDYMSMTEDKADETIADTIAENAILTDPTMSQIRVMEAIEQAGMTRYLGMLKQQMLSPQETQPRPSEAKNILSRDILRQSLAEKPGVRMPPEGITR